MTSPAQEFLVKYGVPRETIHSLSTYERLLVEWNQKFNLIAESTLPHIWSRHFSDSAQLARYIPVNARSLADVGSGAGFPGLVLSIMRPELDITLIESTGKKADFLKTVADVLKLKVNVRNDRVEKIKNLRVDVVTARAVKALPELLVYANHLIKKDSVCIFPKGKNAGKELAQAQKNWAFELDAYPSVTDESGTIFCIRKLVYKSWQGK